CGQPNHLITRAEWQRGATRGLALIDWPKPVCHYNGWHPARRQSGFRWGRSAIGSAFFQDVSADNRWFSEFVSARPAGRQALINRQIADKRNAMRTGEIFLENCRNHHRAFPFEHRVPENQHIGHWYWDLVPGIRY